MARLVVDQFPSQTARKAQLVHLPLSCLVALPVLQLQQVTVPLTVVQLPSQLEALHLPLPAQSAIPAHQAAQAALHQLTLTEQLPATVAYPVDKPLSHPVVSLLPLPGHLGPADQVHQPARVDRLPATAASPVGQPLSHPVDPLLRPAGQ